MIRATARAALPRPTARSASARRPALLILLLMTVLALVGTDAVEQRAAAAELHDDDIWVNVDGVAFEPGRESDEVTYVVRPVGSHSGGRAYTRDLDRGEQYNGWAAFWEARRAYPDGYCVVWVEVEDASNWRETEGRTACTAAEPVDAPPPPAPTSTPTPTPTPSADGGDGGTPTQEPTTEPASPEAAVPTSTPTPTSRPARITTPTPTPTPTPSPTPSGSTSATPSPSPSQTPADATLLQGFQQQPVRTQVDAAEQQEIISPLGWVAVLGSGAVLTAGGLLMLWRRLT